MSVAPARRGILRPPPVVAAVAFAKLALLLWCAPTYGYSGDELYYLACARRLGWGYVDVPPFAVATLALVQRIYGETLLSLRLVPSLTGAAVVILTARLAARFGAGTLGQGLAALAVLVAPELLEVDHVLSPASLEVLLILAASGLIARAVTAEPESATPAWLRVGLMVGLACLNHLATLPWAAAIALGALATTERRWARHPGPWLALGVATVGFAPYLAWERGHQWPTRQVLTHAVHDALASGGPLAFARAQLLAMNPFNVLVWGAGLVALLRSSRLAPYRLFGVAFVLLFLGLAPFGAHAARLLASAYPVLLAAGAAALETRIEVLGARRWAYPALGVLLAASGAVATPLVLPIFRVAAYVRYARALHVTGDRDGRDRDDPAPTLPRHFADMFGWPEMARAVAMVVDALPIEERRVAVVLASNDGEAGALEMFGGLVDLPPVISGHNQYWLWGTAGGSGRVVVAVGGDEATLREKFASVEVATVFGHWLAAPSERHVRVYVCRDSVAPLDELWPSFKRYD